MGRRKNNGMAVPQQPSLSVVVDLRVDLFIELDPIYESGIKFSG